MKKIYSFLVAFFATMFLLSASAQVVYYYTDDPVILDNPENVAYLADNINQLYIWEASCALEEEANFDAVDGSMYYLFRENGVGWGGYGYNTSAPERYFEAYDGKKITWHISFRTEGTTGISAYVIGGGTPRYFYRVEAYNGTLKHGRTDSGDGFTGDYTEVSYNFNEWVNLALELPEGFTMADYDPSIMNQEGTAIEQPNSLALLLREEATGGVTPASPKVFLDRMYLVFGEDNTELCPNCTTPIGEASADAVAVSAYIAGGELFVNGVEEGTQIDIVNLGGQVVASANTNIVDVNGLATGIYIVKAGNAAVKVVK